jgi:peptidoglycan hydrolase CwlO-like protein
MKNIFIIGIIIAVILTTIWYIMLTYTADTAKADSEKFRQIQQKEVDTQRKNIEQKIDAIKNTTNDAYKDFDK